MATIKSIFKVFDFALISIAAVILVGSRVVPDAEAAVAQPRPRFAAMAAGISADSLYLLRLTPLVVDGQTAGAVAVYDDPTTPRTADYLEVIDDKGALVVASWFDRFGIERLVVDRALIEGGNRLKGEFVAVLDGEPI